MLTGFNSDHYQHQLKEKNSAALLESNSVELKPEGFKPH